MWHGEWLATAVQREVPVAAARGGRNARPDNTKANRR